MYKMNRTFFYKTSQRHTLLSKHLGCLKIPDISSSISKPSPRKKKWITLSFKTYLSVVFCMTADSFSTLIYIGQGELPEQVWPKVDEGQSSAAGSRQHQLLQKSRQEVPQLVAIWKLTFEKFSPSFHEWKIHLRLEARRFVGLAFLFFLLFFPFSLGFTTIILPILDTCIKFWIFLIAVKLLALMIYCAKDRWIEIGVKHCVLVSVQNVTFQSQQVYCVSNCLCYLCLVSCKF